jgi:hypothetical protein
LEDRTKGVKMVIEELPAVFLVCGSFESAMMLYARDYDDFNFLKNKFMSYYTSHKFLRSISVLSLLPVKSLKNHKSFDFSGVLRDLLG